MPVEPQYARLPVTESFELTSEEEDDLYTRPPRRQRRHAAKNGKPGQQATPTAFREAATKPVKRYQLLDEEDALGAALQATAPNVTVRAALSPSKKTCLALTCLLVLTGVSTVVWFVPCEWYGCQRPVTSLLQSSIHRDYETMFPGIVVTTRLVVAPAVYVDSADLVFGFRLQDSPAGGVMVVDTTSGAKIWQQDLHEAPTDLQCGGVDLNGNGLYECLAAGPSSMVALINMDKREVEWYLHAHNASRRPLSLLPPLLTSDLTSDGVADLLVGGLLAPEEEDSGDAAPPRTQLMIVDGDTGMVLSQGDIPDCPVALSMVSEEDGADVTLDCMTPETGVSARTLPLTTLTEGLRTPSMPEEIEIFAGQHAPEHPFQVQLENSGVCPGCRGRLTLLDASGAAVWSAAADGARLHSVAQFRHRNHTGVVYKLWQYQPQTAQSPEPGHPRARRWWHPRPAERPVPTLTFEESASVSQSPHGIHFKYTHPQHGENARRFRPDRASPEPDDADGWRPETFAELVRVVWPGPDGEMHSRQLDAVQVVRFCRGPRCEPPTPSDNTVSAAVLDVGDDLDLDLVTLTSLFVPEGDVVEPQYRHQCSLQTRLRKRQLYGRHWQETVPEDGAVSESVEEGGVSGSVPEEGGVSESVSGEESVSESVAGGAGQGSVPEAGPAEAMP